MVVSLINPHDICYMAIRDFAETELDKSILRNGQTELATLDKALELPEGVEENNFFADWASLADNSGTVNVRNNFV